MTHVLNSKSSAFASRVTLFTEAGLWLLIDRSNSQIGRDYRKLFCTQVAPQIARDGRYSPEREVTPEGRIVERAAEEGRRLATEERRLALAEAELEQRRCELRASMLVRLRDELTYIGQDIKDVLSVKAAEEACGRSLPGLLPPADESFHWESPTSIGARMGVSRNAVGKAITALGLRGVEGMSREIVNKAEKSNRTVTSWLYSPTAVAQIEQYLRDNGYIAPR